MPDARDVVRASHCAAGLAFWIDCLPIDSAPIIAFPRETIVDLLFKIRGLSLCPYPYPDPVLAVVTWQPPDAAMVQSPVLAYVRSGARYRDQEPAAASRGCL